MDPATAVLLVAAAAAGGALNAVAGGGSFLTFPALLVAGIPPVAANATSAVALWPASVTSAGAYREDLRHARRLAVVLGVASALGGLVGALVLLGTPEEWFRRAVPFLLLAATLVFAFAPRVLARLRRPGGPAHVLPTWGLALVWLVVATYGGYFGGGMGFLMLATLAAAGLEDIHAMNGLKVAMGALLNAVAIVAFVVAGVVVWWAALLMALASAVGGYAAARWAKRVEPARVRLAVVALGAVVTAWLFWTTYA